MLKNVKKIKNLEIFVTDGPTDWRTDQQTKVYSRLHATKKKKKKKKKKILLKHHTKYTYLKDYFSRSALFLAH